MFNLKSHDCHILMQDLLVIAYEWLRMIILWIWCVSCLIVFKGLCANEMNVDKYDELQSNVILMLYHMKKMFPPSFFTIMVHLIVHFIEEAKLGGPIFYR